MIHSKFVLYAVQLAFSIVLLVLLFSFKKANSSLSYTSTKIVEVNLFAFAYRLFHGDFSPIDGVLTYINLRLMQIVEN